MPPFAKIGLTYGTCPYNQADIETAEAGYFGSVVDQPLKGAINTLFKYSRYGVTITGNDAGEFQLTSYPLNFINVENESGPVQVYDMADERNMKYLACATYRNIKAEYRWIPSPAHPFITYEARLDIACYGLVIDGNIGQGGRLGTLWSGGIYVLDTLLNEYQMFFSVEDSYGTASPPTFNQDTGEITINLTDFFRAYTNGPTVSMVPERTWYFD